MIIKTGPCTHKNSFDKGITLRRTTIRTILQQPSQNLS